MAPTAQMEIGQARRWLRGLESAPGIGCRWVQALSDSQALVKLGLRALLNPFAWLAIKRALVKPALVQRALAKQGPRDSETVSLRWPFALGRWKTSAQRRKRLDRWLMEVQEISGWLGLVTEKSRWRRRNWQEGRPGPD